MWERPKRARAVMLERLEFRYLCSTSLDADGFTVVAPSAHARVVYVSSSTGSDQNGGLSPTSPVATLAKGESLIRNDSTDQLLLKAGDTWSTAFPRWTASGQSIVNPILIGSYGSGARPLILTGDVRSAFYTDGNSPVNNLVISGLQFDSDVRNPTSANFSVDAGHSQDSGFRWYAPTTDLLLQDCSFQYYSDNIDIEGLNGSISGATIFGCQSLDSYTSSGGAYRSQGLYGYDINSITVADSLFDHDGWNATVPGAGQSGYDHDIYLSSTVLNATIDDNVIADASNNGLLARGGGDIENNFFLDDPSAISYGASPGSMSTPGGVHGEIIDNVIMGDASLDGEGYGFGITIANTAPGSPTLVADNIFTGDTQQSKPAIELTSVADTENPTDCVGINDVIIQNNLFNDWYRPIEIESSLQPGTTGINALNDVVIQNNDLQNAGDYLVRYDAAFSAASVQWNHNNYSFSGSNAAWFELDGDVLDFADWKAKVDPTAISKSVSYPDGNATEATYVASLGDGGTLADFLSDERSQAAADWNPPLLAGAVNDYLRAAFGLPTAPVAVSSANSITTANASTDVSGVSTPGQCTFTVTYTDTQAMDDSTIASGNVSVTGPNGFNQPASLVAVDPSADGRSTVVTYSIIPTNNNWTGNADGAYSIVMQPNQVTNEAGMAVPPGMIGAFDVSLPMVVNGTNGNDRISARMVKTNLVVTVNKTITSYPAADVPELEIYTGDGNDRVSIAAHVVPTLINCGDGRDTVTTSNGYDTLMGGTGNDTLSASGGHDLLLAGTGNDVLISGTGADLLEAGTGKDILRGGNGDDVLIGSGGDRLRAGRGNQLLIAATPGTTDQAVLTTLLNTWANSQPFATNIAALSPPNNSIITGSVFSIAGIIFTPDSTADTLIGGNQADWFIVNSDDLVTHKIRSDVSTVLI